MTTYFLSYARADAEFALRFANDLIASGVSVWVDQYDIRPSEHWDRAVEAAVRNCQGMVVILSPRSVASANVADEVSVAIEAGKQVIPILMEACTLPLRMTRMHYIDAVASYEGALRRCLKVMHGPAQAGPGADPPDARLAPEVLETAQRRLVQIMGPIAGVLVRNAATSATSEVELYRELARSIPGQPERERFLAGTPQLAADEGAAEPAPAAAAAPACGMSPDELDLVTRALTRQLGPIARQLVLRETPAAASRQDLCKRLAARITAAEDRAAFFRDVDAG